MFTFSLDDICRAKTISVEIKDDTGNIEGVVYLKEPSAVAGAKLQESISAETPWHELVMNVLALTLSDENGNQLVTTPADRKKLESMPPRMLIALRDPCLEMLNMSWSTGKEDTKIPVDSEDIDQTLARLDDQVAQTYNLNDGLEEPTPEELAAAIPIEGNEHLHLDKDPTDSATSADPTNPFVETAQVPT